ncbi:MAG: hypothetical protein R2706_07635 [Acidimicrobiales bacterium]
MREYQAPVIEELGSMSAVTLKSGPCNDFGTTFPTKDPDQGTQDGACD